MELGLQRDYLLGQHRSDVTNERSFRDVRNLRGDVFLRPTTDIGCAGATQLSARRAPDKTPK